MSARRPTNENIDAGRRQALRLAGGGLGRGGAAQRGAGQ